LTGTFAGTCGGKSTGQCIVDKSTFVTGTETEFSSDDPLLWGLQHGLGPLISFTSNAITSFFVVDVDGKVGIGMDDKTSPASALHVNSTVTNTTPIITMQNIDGDIQLFRIDVHPENYLYGSIGDIVVDSTNGKIYIKETGIGDNIGWEEISATGSNLVDDDSLACVY